MAFTVALATLGVAGNARAVETVALTRATNLPALTGITLNGQSQTTTTTWNLTANRFKVTSSGTPDIGWNLTVNGDSSAGNSAVFKQFCPNASCGTDSAGYVSGGFTLAADSLSLSTASATWTSGTTKPTYQCNIVACPIDSGTAVKIVSASSSVAIGVWTTSGSATMSLNTPSTLHKLQTGEVYGVNLVWTVNTGP
jgi:hypothetical protein